MNLLINSTDCAVHSRAIASAIAKNTDLNGVEAIVAAEFIQQLHYWTEKGAGILKEEVQWIYNTYEQWIDTQFPSLSKYYLRKIKNALISSGLILVKKLRDKQWNQTYHYALKYDALLDLEELKPLKNSKVNTVDHQRSTVCIIDDQHSESSYTKSTSIEDLQKEKNTDQENKIPDHKSDKEKSPNLKTPQEDQETRTNPYSCSVSNSLEKEEVSQVDEKVNESNLMVTQHKPEGDRFFQVASRKSQVTRAEIKERAKMDSAVGMSGFKDVEDLRKCQKELTLYFAKQLEPTKAAEKASWIIKAERQGERSPFVQDFLDGKAIGSWCKEEWEIEPGIVAPVLIAYLRCKLRKNGDTHAHSLNRVSWELKSRNLTANHWAECKRLIDIEKPRLEKALELGQDLVTQNVPEWIIEIYRPEISIERAAETAEVLGAIATQYNDRIEQVQRQLEPAHYAETILYSNDGEAIAIDTLAIKDDDEINFNNISRDGEITSCEENYQAHQIYQPEQIEKGSKSAWEEAISKSKFLSERAKQKKVIGNR